MRSWIPLVIAFALRTAAAADAIELRTASTHPIQYYLSLPQGWSAQKRWPVVMVIESANRQFRNAAEVFAKSRGDRPFILATPLVITNGGPGYRQVPTYHYTPAVWNDIERVGRCKWDEDGLAAVAADIRKSFAGDDRYYVTGFEAGGHTVWALLFRHPNALRAVAPVATNYAGRCMEDGAFHAAVPDLPIRIFAGEASAGGRAASPLIAQMKLAKDTATEHGYRNVTETVVPGKGHVPLADEVLAFFYSDWTR